MVKELVKRIQEAYEDMEWAERQFGNDSPVYNKELGRWLGLKNAYSLITGEKYDHRYE